MNFFKKLSLLLLMFCFSNCEKDKNTNTLKIELDTVIKENDSIHIYYKDDSTIDFNENQSFWKVVNGISKNQKINLIFPDSIHPKQLRLDFGNSINQKEVVINQITFKYKKEVFSLQGKEIYYYFRIDDSVTELDKNLGVLKRKDTLQTRGPSLYPKGNKLIEQLTILYKKGDNAK